MTIPPNKHALLFHSSVTLDVLFLLAKISSLFCPPYKLLPVGKAVLHSCMTVALSLEHFLAKRERAFTACAGPISLLGNSFPYSRLKG